MKNKEIWKRSVAFGMAVLTTVLIPCQGGMKQTVKAAEMAEQQVYNGGEYTQSVSVDFSALGEEDWNNPAMITYASDLSGVETAQNFKITGKVTVNEELYDALGQEGNYVKLQSVIKTGDAWDWHQSEDYPYLNQGAFTATENGYVNEFECTYTDLIPADLHEIIFRVVGIGAKGTVTIGEVAGVNLTKESEPLPSANPAMLDDFETAELQSSAGWEQEAGWQYGNGVALEVCDAYGSRQLKLGLNFTGCEGYTWSEAKIKKNLSAGMDVSAYNQLTYEMTYPEAFANFKTKVFAKNSISDTTIIDKEGTMEISDVGNGMKKAVVTIKFQPNVEAITDITIGTVGVSTNFAGDIWVDNICFSQYNSDSDYVEITSEAGEGAWADMSKMPQSVALSDENAGERTRALYAYLMGLDAKEQVLFGHQNDTHKHVGTGEGVYSDTKDITGSISGIVGIDSLALTGVELGLTNVDEAIAKSVEISKQAAAEGAIITLSTHMPNMSDAKIKATPQAARKFDFSSCDFSESKNLANNCAQEVLPGGAYHAQFTAYLDIIADYGLAMQAQEIPILFRPFHENTGGWFWWGAATTDIETYNAMFRYTHDYLTEKGVHNFIYVYSPNGPITSEEEYAKRYPGDDYVDIAGFDYYDDYNEHPAVWSETFLESLQKTCEVVKSFAGKRGKVAAISETGVRVMKADKSDNEGLLVKNNPIKGQNWYKRINEVAKETGMPYFLVWANFSDTNFYVPYKNGTRGQELINEFIDFYNESSSIFANGTGFYANQTIVGDENEKRCGGYFTNIFAKGVISTEMTLRANVKNAKNVEFVLKNGTASQRILTTSAGNTYEGTVTNAMLQALGQTDVGTIELVADGEALVTLSFISFGKNKEKLSTDIIENFELYYGDNDYLNGTYTENSAANSSSAFELDSQKKASGSYGGVFSYHLKTAGTEVWTGRMKGLENKDLSSYNALSMWVLPDGKGQKLVIQLVSDGEEFEVYLTEFVKTTEPMYVTIPFSQFKGKQNGTLNPANITKFAIWCNSILPDGEAEMDLYSAIAFDDICFGTVDESTLTLKHGYALSKESLVEEKTDVEDRVPTDKVQTDKAPTEETDVNEQKKNNGKQQIAVEGNVVIASLEDTKEEQFFDKLGRRMRRLINGSMSIESRQRILPQGTKMQAQRFYAGEIFDAAKKAIEEYLGSTENFCVMDISLLDTDGNFLHNLDGIVYVTIPIPEGLSVGETNTIAVYRLEADGTLTSCKASIRDGKITFETNHFSTYIFVEQDKSVLAPQTGDDANLASGILLLLLGVVFILSAGKFRIRG